jgi:hypothetical protein
MGHDRRTTWQWPASPVRKEPGYLRFNEPLGLTPALLAFKDADLQTLDGMGRSSDQTGVAAALVTASRLNKFMIPQKYGMPFHTTQPPTQSSAGQARHPRRSPAAPPLQADDYRPQRRWRGKGSGTCANGQRHGREGGKRAERQREWR